MVLQKEFNTKHGDCISKVKKQLLSGGLFENTEACRKSAIEGTHSKMRIHM